MKAIILAAGEGKRLGKYTRNLPKCMLEFNGKPLIQRQVETLRACGIENIIIVKGYMADKIKIHGVKNYINEDFAETNMVDTLFTAEEELNDDVLVCYSDILYEKRVIKEALKIKADVGVVVDLDYWDYWKARLGRPEEDMESMVIDRDGKIVELGSPKCCKENAKARYVGIIKFSKKGIEALKKAYHKNKNKFFDKEQAWLNSKSFKKAYMTDILQALINEGHNAHPIKISRGWLEFDTVKDYDNYSNWLREGTMKRFFEMDA